MTDRLLSTFTFYPFRCQLCARRFRAFLGRRADNPRRSFDRIDVSFHVWMKPRWPSVAGGVGQEGRIENLSLRGCRILCSMPIEVGAKVELEFQPTDNSFPITIDEAVVRASGNGMVGLRFTQLQRSDERRIRQIVDLWLAEAAPSA